MKSIKDLQEQVDKANDGAQKREAQAMQVDNNLNAILTEMQRLEPKQQYLRSPLLLFFITLQQQLSSHRACACIGADCHLTQSVAAQS